MEFKSDYALKLMKKFGWQEGDGLGRDRSGDNQPIKANLKFDKRGIGSAVSGEINNRWWDHGFNKAAKNIVVTNQDGKVELTHKEDVKKRTAATIVLESSPYAGFVKCATLQGNTEVKDSTYDSSSDSSDENEGDLFTKLTNDQLLSICGGNTAHKGARHGLTMSAKLSRIQEQERIYMAKIKSAEASLVENQNELSKKKKKHKKKCEDSDSICNSDVSSLEVDGNYNSSAIPCSEKKIKREKLDEEKQSPVTSSKKVKKLKRKKNVELVNLDAQSTEGEELDEVIFLNEHTNSHKKPKTENRDDSETDEIIVIKQKKKKNKKCCTDNNETNENTESHQNSVLEDDEINKVSLIKKKKSKKKKRSEKENETDDGIMEINGKKSKKKKNKE